MVAGTSGPGDAFRMTFCTENDAESGFGKPGHFLVLNLNREL
jgi:hypothetical protein